MSYLELAQKALERRRSEVSADTTTATSSSAKPPLLTPDEESKILRWIEADEGLPPGSLRFYTQREFRRRYGPAKMIRQAGEWIRIPQEWPDE